MAGLKRSRPDGESNGRESVHPSRKRRVEYTKDDAQLAKIYNDLADDVHTVRLQAAGELLAIVNSKTEGRPRAIESAINRLLKGLCSGRKAARLGFSIALSEVFRLAFALKGVDAEGLRLVDIIDKISTSMQPEGKVSGQERREYLIGRRFAFHAILQSGVATSADITGEDWKALLAAILDLAGEKQWLRNDCGAMLFEFVSSQDGVRLKVDQLAAVISALQEKSLLKTPEGVALWLELSERVPRLKLPKDVWHSYDPLHSKEKPAMKKVLHGVAVDQEQENAKIGSGARQSQPSFAWKVILEHYFRDTKRSDSFKAFWKDAVDGGLFSKSASTERKALGLQILVITLGFVDAKLIEAVLSPNVLRYIVNQRTDSEKFLFEATKVALHEVVARVKAEQFCAPIFVRVIVFAGYANFDQLTKTKTLETVVQNATLLGVNSIVEVVRNMLKAKYDDTKEAENKCRALADLLLMVVRSRSSAEDLILDNGSLQGWLSNAMQTLILYGYSDVAPELGGPLSKQSQTILRSRLNSVLGHLLNQSVEIAAAGTLVPAKILHEMEATMPKQLDKKAKAALQRGADNLDKASKGAQKEQQPKRTSMLAYQLLLGLAMLQVYNEEPDAVEVLDDLCTSFESRKEGTTSTTMIIEVLLSFISKPSALFRKLAEQVFTAFASEMTEESMQSLLDILEQKEDLSGQQELFEQRDGEEDEDEDEEEDEDVDMEDVEDASDVEIVNGEIISYSNAGAEQEDEEDDDESDTEASAEEDEDESEPDEDEEGLLELDRKLTEALGTNNLNPEDSDPDGSDMDDEQMLALEPHLQSIFSQHAAQRRTKSKKQESKDAKENMIQFKNRVLDLLNIYVKNECDNALTLDLALPLVKVVRTTKSKPTAEKAFAVLKTWVETCGRFKKLPAEDAEKAQSRLQEVFEEMQRGGSKLHANACSRASLFLSKILVTIDADENYPRIAKMYAKLQSEWYLDSKSKIQGSVFTEWTSWSLTTRKHK